jgi:acetyl esterase
MSMDSEVRQFVEKLTSAWAEFPPLDTLPIERAREVAEIVRAPWCSGGPTMARTVELEIPTSTGSLRARLHDPGLELPAPLLIYLHGGGFMLFSIDTHDRLMREYAASGQLLVLGVDYPLAPESRYPVALDQLVELVVSVVDGGAPELGVDAHRIALGGDSAGANLSLATALKLRNSGRPNILKGLLLNYGAFGSECSDEAEAQFGGPGAVLQRAEMDAYFDAYLGPGGNRERDPYAEPIFAEFDELPPVFFAIPECDLLTEQSFDVAARMEMAGVDVTSVVYRGATHSFLEATSVSKLARRAIEDGAHWVRSVLDRVHDDVAPLGDR